MTREEFATLVGSRPVILDGATGTNLQKAGMPVGVCPEQWILENPRPRSTPSSRLSNSEKTMLTPGSLTMNVPSWGTTSRLCDPRYCDMV